jgi:hypothetical protein
MGQQLMNSAIVSLSAGGSYSINISSLSTGVYYMRVIAMEGTKVFKIIKE